MINLLARESDERYILNPMLESSRTIIYIVIQVHCISRTTLYACNMVSL